MTQNRAAAAPAGRDRMRYLTASGVAVWGAQVAQVAIPLTAVVALHAGAGGSALLRTTLTLPFVVLGLPVGAWLDRVKRRPVMIAADLVRAVTLTGVAVAYWAGVLSMVQLWVAVLVVGVATTFFDLATQSFVKDLVGTDALAQTNSRLATITQSALVCAPPLAGWGAGLSSGPTLLALTAAGYAWSALWLRSIRRAESPEIVERRRLDQEIRDGLSFVARHRVLRAVAGAGMLVNFATAAVTTVLPVLALRTLGWTESELGAFLGAGGIGGLCGALTARPVVARLGAGRASIGIGIATAPLALTLPFVGAPVPGPVVAGGWALVFYKVGFDAVVMTTFRQHVTPQRLLARMNATMRVCFTAALAGGSTTAGLIASIVDVRAALALAALSLMCVWIPIACSPLRSMRSLDEAPQTPAPTAGAASARRVPRGEGCA